MTRRRSTGRTDFSRRDFLRRSALLAGGLALVSCEDIPGPVAHTPGWLRVYRPRKKIVIVGAGLAGLVAAFELSQALHEVIVLEARPRVGGRVWTVREPFADGQYAEAGAARIPPDHDLTLGYAEYFNLTLDPFYPDEGFYVTFPGGIRSLVPAATYVDASPWPGSVRRSAYLKIRGGADRLPEAFAAALPRGAVRLSTPVEAIEQTTTGVTVLASGGETFVADRVLCTVPLHVLNNIRFTPALSIQKTQAMGAGYRYAASTRVFLRTASRFWEGEGLNGWGDTNLPEEIWQPTWDQGGEGGVLLSYQRYAPAEALDLLDETARVESVLTRWEGVFPGLRDKVENGFSHSWVHDPWSGGAWADPTPEQEAARGSHIGRAEGLVHFAGEHASTHHAWMQGALESGIRAAGEIHFAETPV